MATLVQQTAFGPGTYRGRKFTAAMLRKFVEGTNTAIAAGVPVPLLKRHAKINAGDQETAQFAKEEGVGFVKRVFLDPKTQAIGWEADGVPKDVVKDVKAGTMRFTSPEFRPHYEAELAGVYTGPVIRHFAFAYKPGNPKQGPITEGSIALAEDEHAWQYAEDEKEPLPDPEDDGEEANAEVEANANTAQRNPDLPPAATDASKMKAVIAGLAQLGVVLPSTFDLCDENAVDLLITGLNTRIASNNEHEAELAEVQAGGSGDNEPPPKDAAMPFSEKDTTHHVIRADVTDHVAASKAAIKRGLKYQIIKRVGPGGGNPLMEFSGPRHAIKSWMKWAGHTNHTVEHGPFESQHNEEERTMPLQFSEEELAQMPEALRKRVLVGAAALEAAEAQAAQFEEERAAAVNEAARRDAVAAINAARIPPGLKTLLVEQYEEDAEGGAIQFDEGEEQPRFTGAQVAEMVAAALPPGFLQAFDEEGEESELPNELEEQFDEGPPSGMTGHGRGLHVSPSKARALVAANPVLGGYARRGSHRSHGDLVAEENRRVPNNVMQR